MPALKSKLKANEFYCVKCRARTSPSGKTRKAKAPKTGRPMLKAECKKCGTRVCKFVKSD